MALSIAWRVPPKGPRFNYAWPDRPAYVSANPHLLNPSAHPLRVAGDTPRERLRSLTAGHFALGYGALHGPQSSPVAVGTPSFESLTLAPGVLASPGGYRAITDDQLSVARSRFAEAAAAQGISGTEALFDKLIANTRCIDPISFDLGLIQLMGALNAFLSGTPYVLAINKRDRSEAFVFERMLQLGWDALPEQVIYYDSRGKEHRPALTNAAKDGRKIVLIDDTAYSGTTFKDMLVGIDAPDISSSIFAGVVGIAEQAFTYFARKLPDAARFAAYRMPPWGYGLSDDERGALLSLLPVHHTGTYAKTTNPGDRVDSFIYYKQPDNVPAYFIPLGLFDGGNTDNDRPVIQPNYAALLKDLDTHSEHRKLPKNPDPNFETLRQMIIADYGPEAMAYLQERINELDPESLIVWEYGKEQIFIAFEPRGGGSSHYFEFHPDGTGVYHEPGTVRGSVIDGDDEIPFTETDFRWRT